MRYLPSSMHDVYTDRFRSHDTMSYCTWASRLLFEAAEWHLSTVAKAHGVDLAMGRLRYGPLQWPEHLASHLWALCDIWLWRWKTTCCRCLAAWLLQGRLCGASELRTSAFTRLWTNTAAGRSSSASGYRTRSTRSGSGFSSQRLISSQP